MSKTITKILKTQFAVFTLGLSLMAITVSGLTFAFQNNANNLIDIPTKTASADTSCPGGYTLVGDVCEQRSAFASTCDVGTLVGLSCLLPFGDASGWSIGSDSICPSTTYPLDIGSLYNQPINFEYAKLCTPNQLAGIYYNGSNASCSGSNYSVRTPQSDTVGNAMSPDYICIPNIYKINNSPTIYTNGSDVSGNFNCSGNDLSFTYSDLYIYNDVNGDLQQQLYNAKICIAKNYTVDTLLAGKCNQGLVETSGTLPCVRYQAQTLNYASFVKADGTQVRSITATPGSTIQQRIYYDNTTAREITGASLQASLPAGFSYVAGSFRNCKAPTAAESYCDSNGATVDNAMFAKLTSTGLSPAAAFYDSADTGANGTSPTSTTGILDAGKKRYLSLNGCSYGTGGGDFNLNTLVNANKTDSQNLPNTNSTNCFPSYLGSNFLPSYANSAPANYSLVNNKYFNLGQCGGDTAFKYVTAWTNQPILGGIRTTSTGTSNLLIGSDGCVGGDSFGRGWNNYTLLGNRYLNIDQCVHLYNSTFQTKFTNILQTPTNNTSTNTSNSPITSNSCSGVNYLPAFSSVKAIDLLDISRARGYFTFQMTVPTTNVQPSYTTTPTFTGTSPLTGAITPVILSGTILTGVNTCTAGNFFNSTTVTCNPCPAGSFCTGGSAQPVICPANTYCLASAPAATPCPVNTSSPAGSTTLSACVNNVPPNLTLKFNLAGTFDNNTDLMSTTLASQSILPSSQPFNVAPWNYTGTETAGGLNGSNSNVCDWFLIEVRDGTTDALVTRKAGIYYNTGLSGSTLPGVTSTGNYKIIVRTRNHIAIATNTPVTLTMGGTTNVDFTSNVNVKSNNQIQVGTVGAGNTGAPIYGLRLGDSNSDGSIDALDRSFISSSPEFDGVYDTKDVNLDGAVDAFDRSLSQNALEASEVL